MIGPETPELHVEGADDLHTIIHLLRRHGLDVSLRPIELVIDNNLDQLMRNVDLAIRAATSHAVGFVFDIDVDVQDRWKSIRKRLIEVDVDAPEKCPKDGFIGNRRGYPQKVGVWLMPDCESNGSRLEDLLKTLVPQEDRLWRLAQSSTADARQNGARFRDQDQAKAEIHCWLAWQEEPGLPYGTAIKAEYLGHDSPQALAFLDWLKRLFGITFPAKAR